MFQFLGRFGLFIIFIGCILQSVEEVSIMFVPYYSSSLNTYGLLFNFGVLVVLTDRIILSKNGIGGNIPTKLGALSSLNKLCLAENNLEEGIPTELGQLKILSKLRIL